MLSQFSLVDGLCPTLWDPMDSSRPGFPVHHQLSELAQTHVHQVGHAIQLPNPLSSPSLPSLNLSQHQGLFQWTVLHIKWPKYWSFSFKINPSNEYSGLLPLRIDCFDLLAVQRTLKSSPTPQFNSINSLVLNFIVQLSHSYINTGKTIALTRWTFVGKVMSLLFNMLSRLVKAFLPRGKFLLISWLPSPSAVNL